MTVATAVMLKLGEKYKDLISGYEGIAVVRTTLMNGITEIALDGGMDKEGARRKSIYVHIAQLRTMDDQLVELPDLAPNGIELGKEYRDRVTDLVGTATMRSDSIDGCIQYVLEQKVDPKTGNKRESYWFDDARLIDLATEQKAATQTAGKGADDFAIQR